MSNCIRSPLSNASAAAASRTSTDSPVTYTESAAAALEPPYSKDV